MALPDFTVSGPPVLITGVEPFNQPFRVVGCSIKIRDSVDDCVIGDEERVEVIVERTSNGYQFVLLVTAGPCGQTFDKGNDATISSQVKKESRSAVALG